VKDVLVLPGDFFEIDMTDRERRVLATLMRHDLKGDGLVWPSQASIAEKLGLDRADVTRAINGLAAAGHIAIIRRGRANSYRLADRFIAAREGARRAKPASRRQGHLMLPIEGRREASQKGGETPPIIGGETPPIERPIGGKSPPIAATGGETPPEITEIGGDSPTTGGDLPPGREGKNPSISSSTTESGAARAREAPSAERKKIAGRDPVARAARPRETLPTEADMRRTIEGWIGKLGQFVRDTMPGEVGAFWAEAMRPLEEARPYLDRVDKKMRAHPTWLAEHRGEIAERRARRQAARR